MVIFYHVFMNQKLFSKYFSFFLEDKKIMLTFAVRNNPECFRSVLHTHLKMKMNKMNFFNHVAKTALRVVLAVLLVFVGSFSLRAQARARTIEEQALKVYFQFDKSFVNDNYMGNAATLSMLDSLVAAGGVSALESVKVVSYSSPEGNYAYNLALSKKRTESINRLLLAAYPELEGRIELDYKGEAWQDLRSKVEADSNFTEEVRSKILAIIDSDQDPTSKEISLKALPQYKRLYANYFKQFRYAEIRLRIANSQPEPVQEPEISIPEPEIQPVEEEEIVTPQIDTIPIDTPVVVPVAPAVVPEVKPAPAPQGKKTYFALKTNLLYDAVTALNFEVEVPIAGRWSVMAEDVFPWWHIDNKYAFQMWEMGIEGRFWFKPWDVNGTEKMRGWFVGAYGMSSKYDFQYDRSINYQGEYWSAGITAGYVMPIGKKKRMNLEFSLSAGYLQTDYRHYFPADDYSVLIRDPYNMGTVSYFGPTKAKVSLIIPINFSKKGGER